MLLTNLGAVCVDINQEEYNYKAIKLSNKEKRFVVDGRYLIVIDTAMFKTQVVEIQCRILFDDMYKERLVESGEDLALISFVSDCEKVSIGTNEFFSIDGVHYEYMNDGIKIIFEKHADVKQIVFGIAWKHMRDIEKEQIYTWLAADPT